MQHTLNRGTIWKKYDSLSFESFCTVLLERCCIHIFLRWIWRILCFLSLWNFFISILPIERRFEAYLLSRDLHISYQRNDPNDSQLIFQSQELYVLKKRSSKWRSFSIVNILEEESSGLLLIISKYNPDQSVLLTINNMMWIILLTVIFCKPHHKPSPQIQSYEKLFQAYLVPSFEEFVLVWSSCSHILEDT